MKPSAFVYGGLLVLALFLFMAKPTSAEPVFTGNAPTDFTNALALHIPDFGATPGAPDVKLPTPPFAPNDVSGWDVNGIYFQYDVAADRMYISIDCFKICGDADGDGDPGAANSALTSTGGEDPANLGANESITLLIDTNNDYTGPNNGDFEVAIGKPLLADLSAFGVYHFTGDPAQSFTGYDKPLSNMVRLFSQPSRSKPDLEFSIAGFSTLPGFNFKPGEAFQFQINLAAGSQVDGPIGNDYLPGQGEALPVVVPASLRQPSTITPVLFADSTKARSGLGLKTATLWAVPPPDLLPTTGADLRDEGKPGFFNQLWDNLQQRVKALFTRETQVGTPQTYPYRLTVPGIGLDAPVRPMTWHQTTGVIGQALSEWTMVDNAAGWHINSVFPGAQGNIVFSGHNNIAGSVFRNLYQIRQGDKIIVWTDTQHSSTYVADNILLLPEAGANPDEQRANAAWIGPSADSRLTLVSCWPPNSNTHRVIVVAHLQKQ